jgi:hypothetical protein
MMEHPSQPRTVIASSFRFRARQAAAAGAGCGRPRHAAAVPEPVMRAAVPNRSCGPPSGGDARIPPDLIIRAIRSDDAKRTVSRMWSSTRSSCCHHRRPAEPQVDPR